jgi:hypothetical protein
MNEIINKLVFSGPDLLDVSISLVISTVLGILISQLYKGTHRGMNYENTFMSSLVLMAPIVTLVMLYVRGDLVLSLGLIGSLSIVRFRTAIKDTRDMIFIFWVIAIGLGSGTYNWSIVLLSSLFIMIVVYILYFIRYGQVENRDFILSVSGSLPHPKNQVSELLAQYARNARLRSFEVQDQRWETIYELRVHERAEGIQADELIRELKNITQIENVSLLAPQLSLPL